jgi:hypothetical protein
MAINRTQGFEAVEADLTLYNGQAVLNLPIYYYLEGTESDNDGTVDGEYVKNYPFSGYTSSFMNVYDSEERNTLVKSFTSQITRNSNIQVINASVSDMTFDQNGTYFYELGYVRSGYDIVLRFGKLFIK